MKKASQQTGKPGRGRPSSYKPETMLRQARIMSLAGWTDAQMADLFGVALSTLALWKKEHPEFSDALKAKDIADAEVEVSLYQRALGYSHPEVHVSNYQGQITLTPITKHYPPDPTSMIFWLKNRQPERWREKAGEGSAPDRAETLRRLADGLPD